MMRDTELTGLAMTLGRDTKMRITVGGEHSHCSPDGSRIHIAKMPLTSLGRLLSCGLVFHELGHKLHTTGDRPPGLLGELTNAIEDVRTEALTIKERPGTRYDLEAVPRYYLEKAGGAPSNIAGAFLGLVLVRGRRLCLRQQGLEEYDERCCEILEETFGRGFVGRIETTLEADYGSLRSTDDARRLAQRLIDLVSDQAQARRPDPQGKAKGDEPAEDEEAKGKEKEQENEAPSDFSQGPGQNNSGSKETDDGNKAPSPHGTSGRSQEEKEQHNLTGEEIERMIQQGSGGEDLRDFLTRELDQLALSLGQEETPELPELPPFGRHKPSGCGIDESAAISAASRMRARLLLLLQAVRSVPRAHGCSGRKLDTRRLVRMGMGDARLYKKRIEKSLPNTAVMILLDASGSMADETDGQSRAHVANQAAFALHHALFAMEGVKVASAEFSQRHPERPSVNLLAGFEEKPRGDAFAIEPDGGTPTHSALWAARAMLLQRPEPRRILLLITDGYPSAPTRTEAATRRCSKEGIEIAALGIETDAVKRYWRNHQIITKLETLPQSVFSVTEALLPSPIR